MTILHADKTTAGKTYLRQGEQKMNEIFQEGKTKEEALEAALKRLGVKEDEVEVELISAAREGFLGFFGQRNVKIKVTLLNPKDEPYEDDSSSDASDVVERTVDLTGSAHKEKTPAPPRKKPAAKKRPAPANGQMFNPADPPEDQIGDFIMQIFEIMEADCSVDVIENQNEISVEIGGEDAGIIIGKFGQTLDSLQYLVNVIAGKKMDCKKKIIINVGDYRERREVSVKKLARSVARKVAKSQKSEFLSPMPPQDRRIVHLALSNFKNVKTASEGEGANRKVIISYKRDSADKSL